MFVGLDFGGYRCAFFSLDFKNELSSPKKFPQSVAVIIEIDKGEALMRSSYLTSCGRYLTSYSIFLFPLLEVPP